MAIKAHKYITLSSYISQYTDKKIYYLNLNLDNLIDHYDYHDAPSSVDLYLDKEEIEKLIESLQKLIEDSK